MITASPPPKSLFPLEVSLGLIAQDAAGLARIVVDETNKQIEEAKAEQKIDDEADLVISSDALNFWRMEWRCREEMNVPSVPPGIEIEMTAEICRLRGYNREEFDFVKVATKERARIPFGWEPLQFAFTRACKQPIQLTAPELRESQLATIIAGMAKHLQELQKEKSILLPIDPVSNLLRLRKTTVSGVLTKLVEHKIIEVVGEKYHTKHAREFRFIGRLSEDWIEAPRNE